MKYLNTCDLMNYANLMAMLAVKQEVDTYERVVLMHMSKHDATCLVLGS